MTSIAFPPHARACLLAAAASPVHVHRVRAAERSITLPRDARHRDALLRDRNHAALRRERDHGGRDPRQRRHQRQRGRSCACWACRAAWTCPTAADTSIDLRGFGATADNNQVVVVDGVRISEADLRRHAPGRHPDRVGRAHRGAARQRRGAVRRGRHRRRDRDHDQGRHRPPAGQWRHRLRRGRQLRAARAARQRHRAGSGGFALDASAQKRKTDGYRANSAPTPRPSPPPGQWTQRLAARGCAPLAGRPGHAPARRPHAAQYAADPRQSSTPGRLGHHPRRRGAVFATAELAGVATGLRRRPPREGSAQPERGLPRTTTT